MARKKKPSSRAERPSVDPRLRPFLQAVVGLLIKDLIENPPDGCEYAVAALKAARHSPIWNP